MKIFKNKFFISFLILTTVIYGLSANIAHAGGIGDFFSSFVAVVITIVAVATAQFWVPATLISVSGGTVLATGTVSSLSSLALATAAQTVIVSSVSSLTIAAIGTSIAGTLALVPSGSGGSSVATLIPSSNIGCAFQLPLTFYNSVSGCTLIDINSPLSDSNGNFIGYATIPPPDDTKRKIAIYRYTLPVSATSQELSDWLISFKQNSLIANLGTAIKGCSSSVFDISSCGYEYNYYWNNPEPNPIAQVDYLTMCDSSGICKFTDQTVPPDYYVLYTAKILGADYGYGEFNGDTEVSVYRCVSGNNKFLAPESSMTYVSFGNLPNNITDNGYIGPYKTSSANCPSPPTIDYFTSTPIAEVPDPIYVSWGSSNTTSCTASNAWSGGKSTSGQEAVYKGRGSYTFDLSCSDTSGQSASANTNSQVIEVPRCAFSANPSTIELPEVSTISWSCQYAQSCSISPTISSVNSASGSLVVRPTNTTTFTLSCQGIDGLRSYQTTVDVQSSTGAGSYKEVPVR